MLPPGFPAIQTESFTVATAEKSVNIDSGVGRSRGGGSHVTPPFDVFRTSAPSPTAQPVRPSLSATALTARRLPEPVRGGPTFVPATSEMRPRGPTATPSWNSVNAAACQPAVGTPGAASQVSPPSSVISTPVGNSAEASPIAIPSFAPKNRTNSSGGSREPSPRICHDLPASVVLSSTP